MVFCNIYGIRLMDIPEHTEYLERFSVVIPFTDFS